MVPDEKQDLALERQAEALRRQAEVILKQTEMILEMSERVYEARVTRQITTSEMEEAKRRAEFAAEAKATRAALGLDLAPHGQGTEG